MFTWGFSSSNAFTCVHLGRGDANAFGGCVHLHEEMQMRSGVVIRNEIGGGISNNVPLEADIKSL